MIISGEGWSLPLVDIVDLPIGFSELELVLGLLPDDKVHNRLRNNSQAGNTELHSLTWKNIYVFLKKDKKNYKFSLQKHSFT